MPPTIGRIVIVRLNGEDRPALITRVHSNTCINVAMFLDDATQFLTLVEFGDGQFITNRTWRWPVRN